jgi:hypothetical protein
MGPFCRHDKYKENPRSKRELSESPAESQGNSLCTGLVTYCLVIM